MNEYSYKANGILRRLRCSLVKKLLKSEGYTNYSLLATLMNGLSLEPFPHLYSDTYIVSFREEPVAKTKSVNTLEAGIDELYIVGSGPSVLTQDLTFLKTKKVILLNGAVSLIKTYGITPFFIVIIDDRFCRYNPDLVRMHCRGTNLLVDPQVLMEMMLIDKTIASACDIYLSVRPGQKERPITDEDEQIEWFDKFEYGRIEAGTVLGEALRLASKLRAKNTYVIGFDIGNANTEPRFYEKKPGKVQSGLLQDYNSKILPFMKMAARFFRENGMNLYNCSPVTMLPYDIIPFKSIEDLA